MGSLTLFGALEMQILHRTSSSFGFGLFVLWAFSPLGGQASLRLLVQEERQNTSSGVVRYLDVDSSSILSLSSNDSRGARAFAEALYESALLTPTSNQQEATDVYENLKIPFIEDIETNCEADNDGWFMSGENDCGDFESYSTLVGLPIFGLADPLKREVAVFNVESSYMVASCTTRNSSEHELLGVQDGGFTVNFTGGTRWNISLYPGQDKYLDIEPINVTFASAKRGNSRLVALCTLTRSSIENEGQLP